VIVLHCTANKWGWTSELKKKNDGWVRGGGSVVSVNRKGKLSEGEKTSTSNNSRNQSVKGTDVRGDQAMALVTELVALEQSKGVFLGNTQTKIKYLQSFSDPSERFSCPSFSIVPKRGDLKNTESSPNFLEIPIQDFVVVSIRFSSA